MTAYMEASANMAKIAEHLIPHSISGRVFPIHFEALKSLWRRGMRRADLHDLHFHDLRHEAISQFFEMGLSIPEVALISGHRDPRKLLRYIHLRAEDVANKIHSMQCTGNFD